MSEKFQGRYQVQDGYVGGARLQHVSIDADGIEDDMTDKELIAYYEDAIQQHFEENVTPGADRVDEFVSWAREQLEKRGKE
jgi:hypothetical protein